MAADGTASTGLLFLAVPCCPHTVYFTSRLAWYYCVSPHSARLEPWAVRVTRGAHVLTQVPRAGICVDDFAWIIGGLARSSMVAVVEEAGEEGEPSPLCGVSGRSLVYGGALSRRAVVKPAGGCWQVVEPLCVEYTLSARAEGFMELWVYRCACPGSGSVGLRAARRGEGTGENSNEELVRRPGFEPGITGLGGRRPSPG